MMSSQKDCIIIGAGVTGLTAAYYLKKEHKDFLVLERNERVGGAIKTVNEAGFLYETGPNTGVLGQAEVAELIEDLGDQLELEIAKQQVKKRYILKNNKWEALPAGIRQAVNTPLFSTRDKFRILGEPFRPRGNDPEETLKELVERRMGKSFLSHAIDPFILGVYAGDPATLVPKYALPKLYNLEQKYGSFIGGSIRKKFSKKSERDKKATRDVFSFKGGLQSLVNALYEQAGKERFSLGANEVKILKKEGFFTVEYKDNTGKKISLNAANVIVTTGSESLRELLPEADVDSMETMTNLRYARVIEVALGFNEWKEKQPDAFGGLIPFVENRDILGILYPSAFLEGRAPAGGELFTLFIGGLRRPELFELNDEQLFSLVKKEFTELMGLKTFEPDLFRIFRYPTAIPQYEKSSGKRFEAIRNMEKSFPGLFLRGNFQGGIGLADRIRQGKIASDDSMQAG